jgi:O-antigen ligase
MMRSASRSISYWLGYGNIMDTWEEENIPDAIFFSGLILAGIIVINKRRINWSGILNNNKWLIYLIIYCGLSIFWAEYQTISLKRYIKALGDVLMALIVLTERNPIGALEKLFRKAFFLLIPLSIILIKYFPHLGRHQSKNWGPDMWIGVATHKNTLGQLCLIAGLYFIWDSIKNRDRRDINLINIIYLLMIVYLIYGGGHSISNTCVTLLPVGLIIYLLIEKFRSRILGVLCGAAIFFLVLQTASEVFLQTSIYESIVEIQGKDISLAGRTDLWQDLISIGMKQPLFGAGFGGFWIPSRLNYFKELYTWGPGQAHNGYIEIFLNIGLVGLWLFIITVIVALKVAMRQINFDFKYGAIRITLLVVTLLHNYTESGFIRPTHLIWFIFLLMAINMPQMFPGSIPLQKIRS